MPQFPSKENGKFLNLSPLPQVGSISPSDLFGSVGNRFHMWGYFSGLHISWHEGWPLWVESRALKGYIVGPNCDTSYSAACVIWSCRQTLWFWRCIDEIKSEVYQKSQWKNPTAAPGMWTRSCHSQWKIMCLLRNISYHLTGSWWK